MSDDQTMTFEQALIERQSVRLGQMATQIESLVIQLEQAQIRMNEMGYNLDGSPLVKEEANPSLPFNGEMEDDDARVSP